MKHNKNTKKSRYVPAWLCLSIQRESSRVPRRNKDSTISFPREKATLSLSIRPRVVMVQKQCAGGCLLASACFELTFWKCQSQH